jgi:hypothetical protein
VKDGISDAVEKIVKKQTQAELVNKEILRLVNSQIFDSKQEYISMKGDISSFF